MLKQFEPIEPAEVIPLPGAVVEAPVKATPAGSVHLGSGKPLEQRYEDCFCLLS